MFDEAKKEFETNYEVLRDYLDPKGDRPDQCFQIAQAAATMCLLSGLEEIRRILIDIRDQN